MYVTNATRCSVLARRHPSEASAEIPALNLGHEEAETRLLLHGIYAAEQGSQTVIICSPDTDVLVTLPAAIGHQPAVFGFDTGTGNYRRLVNATNMGKSLGAPLCQVAPFLHGIDKKQNSRTESDKCRLTLQVSKTSFRTLVKTEQQ